MCVITKVPVGSKTSDWIPGQPVLLLCFSKAYLSNKESLSLKWAGSAEQGGRVRDEVNL